MEKDKKGWVKISRKIEYNGIWSDTTVFGLWVKMLVIADRRVAAIEMPVRKLAERLNVSVNTLRKALAFLEESGSIKYQDGRIEIINYGKYQDGLKAFEDFDAPEDFTPGEAGESGESEEDVSNFDTEEAEKKEGLCQNLTQAYKEYKHKQAVYKNPYSPHRGRADFMFFLQHYPNKKTAEKAGEAWEKYSPDLGEVINGLCWQVMLRDWHRNNGRYVPTAVKYITKRLYKDEAPQGEVFYILDVLNPVTEKEKLVAWWLGETNTELLSLGDNMKINAAFEPDREVLERMAVRCGGDLELTRSVLVKGWLAGCKSLAAIEQRAVSYIQEINSEKYGGR
ncbi:DNA-binding Lrp family transcriptional regulator [Elusimicrobium simillimum]|uniref:DeoR family transcriptional regulator n=1 Tax=Elusimicrobium simillimum TaxID=3143438 RepID=UPI003C6EBCDE